jgi:hypothetical protein
MRCPSCGTDNAPDSRFCGGCGARLASDPRVAPTQKISDDARFPLHQITPAPAPVTAPGVVMPRPIPPPPFVAQGAPSAPPAMPVHPISTPPQPRLPAAPDASRGTRLGARDPARPRPQALVIDDPSLSLPTPARRPWALILVVLLIDIGLAVSGAWLLDQGLGGGPGGASSDASPPRAR